MVSWPTLSWLTNVTIQTLTNVTVPPQECWEWSFWLLDWWSVCSRLWTAHSGLSRMTSSHHSITTALLFGLELAMSDWQTNMSFHDYRLAALRLSWLMEMTGYKVTEKFYQNLLVDSMTERQPDIKEDWNIYVLSTHRCLLAIKCRWMWRLVCMPAHNFLALNEYRPWVFQLYLSSSQFLWDL